MILVLWAFHATFLIASAIAQQAQYLAIQAGGQLAVTTSAKMTMGITKYFLSNFWREAEFEPHVDLTVTKWDQLRMLPKAIQDVDLRPMVCTWGPLLAQYMLRGYL